MTEHVVHFGPGRAPRVSEDGLVPNPHHSPQEKAMTLPKARWPSLPEAVEVVREALEAKHDNPYWRYNYNIERNHIDFAVAVLDALISAPPSADRPDSGIAAPEDGDGATAKDSAHVED